MPGASLSSCCGYHPASVSRRISQIATSHAAFARHPRARPLELDISRPPLPLLPLRPDDSLPILTMALSMDSQSSVSFPLAIQATGLLTFAPVGLTLPLNTPAFRDLFGSRRKDHFLDIRETCPSPADAKQRRASGCSPGRGTALARDSKAASEGGLRGSGYFVARCLTVGSIS